MHPPQSLVSSIVITSLLFAAIVRPSYVSANPGTAQDPTVDGSDDDKKQGLRFRLSQGSDVQEARQREKIATTTNLSQAEIENLLKRLPPMEVNGSDEQEFHVRQQSLPPPRTGITQVASFPSNETVGAPETTPAGPLEVVSYAPEGSVPFAPYLNVTFSQPMVGVSSQAESELSVPVKLSPQPAGKWRWLGTKTIQFQPEGRFPMATNYTVTVPAGTQSATGTNLVTEKRWGFSTPPPVVKKTFPDGRSTQPRRAVMYVEFDQAIDPEAVLQAIEVRAAGKELPIRLTTADEISSDKAIQRMVNAAKKNYWVAFRAVESDGTNSRLALPPATQINVSVGPQIPSAEGSLTNAETSRFSFSTFGQLRVTNHECGYENDCEPDSDINVYFSNSLDKADFNESKIRIEPKVEDVEASVEGNTLSVSGSFKANSTIQLTIDRSVKDIYGQTLDRDVKLSINVGKSAPRLEASGGEAVVLDPFGPARYSVFSMNYDTLKVRLYAVTVDDWPKWQEYRGNTRDERPSVPPGRLLSSRTIRLRSNPDDWIETSIDLRAGLKDGLGHVIVIVEPPGQQRKFNEDWKIVETWVQRTNIGLDAVVDNENLLGWATSLRDGTPIQGVEMTLLPYQVKATTDATGMARLDLKPELPKNLVSFLLAKHGKDVAILDESFSWDSTGQWYRTSTSDRLAWYVFDDRGLYRPGEEVHVKGWLRRIVGRKNGDVESVKPIVKRISYALHDSRSNDIAKGIVDVNLFGGFDLHLKLPANINLGQANLKLTSVDPAKEISDTEFDHRFRVAEFRRPEFEVKTKNNSSASLMVGDHADLSVAANYYAGGGLADAEVKWQVTAKSTNFTPPNREDFTFGQWEPWWQSTTDPGSLHTETFEGRTDSLGIHHLRVDFDSVNPARPSSVTAEAIVTDVNRQNWSSKTTILVHPSRLYVGLKSDTTFVDQGKPFVVQAIVTDLDGVAAPNREIKMRSTLVEWKQVKGEWQEVETAAGDCSIRSGMSAVICTLPTKPGGEYRVTATIQDEQGRLNESELSFWVAGGQLSRRDIDEDEVELIPDRQEFKAGDVANILVRAPFWPAEGVLTLQRSGIVKTERFRIDSATYTLRLPIEEGWVPNIHLEVILIGASERDIGERKPKAEIPKRPAYAQGQLNLAIPPTARKLEVIATPKDKALEPGAETIVNVEAKDANGRPVSDSEVAVVAVDESILALTEYQLADPLNTFYKERDADVTSYHSRQNLVLANIEIVSGRGMNFGGGGPGGGDVRSYPMVVDYNSEPPAPAVVRGLTMLTGRSASGEAEQPIRLRQNFDALAVFAPSVRTDSNGRAEVKFKLPDNLTRYRVMAVAVAGEKQFGFGESAITARLPLMSRPSAPRFLNLGDRFELPIVIQNQTEKVMTVDVAVRANDVLQFDAGPGSSARMTIAGRRVNLDANGRVEVRIPATAAKTGKARFQVAALSSQSGDASEVQLPVLTPATSESFATYGEINQGAITQPIKAPADVFPQFGGLEIETSSTQLQQLTDAFLYLQSYPYECAEQLASRILSVAALRDVLSTFKSEGLPTAQEMQAAVDRDLKRLGGMQNDDGGFGFWKRNEQSWPFLSVHVAHALARAKQKGFAVPQGMFDKSLKYLREIEHHFPSHYKIDAQWAISAYALYVRAQMGDRDPAKGRKLIGNGDIKYLSLEANAWLLSVFANDSASTAQRDAIRRLFNNRVVETASTAHFATSYGDDDYVMLHSNRRTDGIILESLIADQPSNPLIPKLVRGLLDQRTRGRWSNTQENVFILLALDRYFNAYEKVTPDFVARLWLGDTYAGEQQFKGRSVDRQQVNVPMSYMAKKSSDSQNLIVSKNGPGRLYYRVAMNYAPKDLSLTATDYGFAVQRSYEAVDHVDDVKLGNDGTWHVKAGARVRVRLTMVAPSRRYHVALVDPLPAGFESLNPELAVTESVPQDKTQEGVISYGSRSFGNNWWLWRPTWFDHQNLRDDRAEAFTSLLWEGVYTYSYVARATTPGLFIVPPAKAEEMYHPETFGRSKTERVRIQ